jgi:DNA-binding NarL/FixJ family response regulator
MRVVIAEDNGLLLDSLATALPQRGIEVVGTARSLPEVLHVVAQTIPDIVMLDIRMPPTGTDEGIRAAESIRSTWPDIGLVVLAERPVGVYAERLLAMSGGRPKAVGYIIKDNVGDLDKLCRTLDRVAEREIDIDPAVAEQMVKSRTAPGPLDTLTPRERDVLKLMAQGRSNRGIAQAFGCAESTVVKHVSAISDKLDLRIGSAGNLRVRAVITYLRSNPAMLVETPPNGEPPGPRRTLHPGTEG